MSSIIVPVYLKLLPKIQNGPMLITQDFILISSLPLDIFSSSEEISFYTALCKRFLEHQEVRPSSLSLISSLHCRRCAVVALRSGLV